VSKHTLSVLVENKPGVLTRIAGLFSRRGYNIESLSVGPTGEGDFSRLTIVVDLEHRSLEHVIGNLDKLVSVLEIVELDQPAAV
jgi:acetolactate synthase-1/3 small subunit